MDLNRELLLREASKIVSIPSQDFSKMTNGQIEKRNAVLEATFDELFKDEEES